MTTKNIFKFLAACLIGCGITAAFTGCSDDDPRFTVSEDDYPRILNTDIPQGEGGEPGVIMNIDRNQNFEFEVIVTPVHYTTVTWFIDGEQVAEGLKINVPVLAGDHIVKIVATTTKGLSTSRTCKLVVRPLDGDPALAEDAKSRWLTIGTTKTIDCTNVTSVSKILIGKTEATNVSYANGKLTFDVPEMEEGDYHLTLEDASGTRYGCNVFTVSNDEYVEPGMTEKVLWEGSYDVTWDTPFKGLQHELADQVQAGTVLRVHVTGNGQGTAATSWWRNLITGISDDDEPGGRGDIQISGDMDLEFTLTDLSMQLLAEQDGFFMVGNGYTVTKISILVPSASEKVLWEGSYEVTWDTPFKGMQHELADQVKPGTVLRVHVTGEGQGTAATSWWRNLITGISEDDEPGGRGDNPISGDMELEYTLTDLSMQLLAEQDGFFMVGNGYTVTKISILEAAAPETVLWEGSYEVTWDTPFKGLQFDLAEKVKAGTVLSAYVTGEGQGTAATSWWRNIVTGISDDDEPGGRGDTPISGDMVLEYTLTDLSLQLLAEQDGFFMVGNGYTLTKVTIK